MRFNILYTATAADLTIPRGGHVHTHPRVYVAVLAIHWKQWDVNSHETSEL